MTRDEMVAQIQLQLGFRTTLSTEIVTSLTLAIIGLEKLPEKPWFLISEDTFTTTTADEERVAIPDDFIEEVDEATLKYRPDDYPTESEVDLVKGQYDTLRALYAEEEAGPPEAYALLGEYFRFFPLPDDDYNVRLIYYKKSAALSSGSSTNVWSLNAPHLLMGTAGLQIANPVRDSFAVGVFKEWISMDASAIINKNIARQLANSDLQMGGRHF